MKTKRILALVLSLCMIFTMLPTFTLTASAANGTIEKNADGYYEISDAEDLYAFATMVNGGETDANAILTADITVNQNVLKEDFTLNGDGSGFKAWTPIGTSSTTKYLGTFDGQGHTISGLYFNNTDTTAGKYVGLFGYFGGTIKNLEVVDSYFNGYQYVGAIVGYGNTKNIYVQNCKAIANIYASNGYAGGIVGYAFNLVITNSLAIGPVKGIGNVGAVAGGAKATNCYYLDGYAVNTNNEKQYGVAATGGAAGAPADAIGSCTAVTIAQLNSGEVAYKLQETQEDTSIQVWGQKLDGDNKDAYPTFSSDRVYLAGTADAPGYSNTNDNVEDYTQPTVVTESNYESLLLTSDYVGYYAIADYAQLCSFAEIVTAGEYDADAVLLNNIIANKNVLKEDGSLNGDGSNLKHWKPILPAGDIENSKQDKKYTGTFDGNNKYISGLYYNVNGGTVRGLFGYVGEGGVIKNLGIIDSYFYGQRCVGAIAGSSSGTIENCYNKGTVKAYAKPNSGYNSSEYFGGIVGSGGGEVKNCYNEGIVSAGTNASYIGGICGYGRAVENCYNTGKIDGDTNVGGVVGYTPSSISNCYNTGDITCASTTPKTMGYTGGVVGKVYSTGENVLIEKCWNSGTVTSKGASYIGGVIGGLATWAGAGIWTVKNCYNTGDVVEDGTSSKNLSTNIGGLIGSVNISITKADIQTSYNIGTISGGTYVGGLVGTSVDNLTLTDCYYLEGCATDSTGTVQNAVGNTNEGSTTADTEGAAAKLTLAQMTDDTAWKTNFAGFDTTNVWTKTQNTSSTKYSPKLISDSQSVTPSHTHVYTYQVSTTTTANDTITATCSAADCTNTGEQTITIAAPDETTHTGSVIPAKLTGSINGVTNPIIGYTATSGSLTDGKPVNVGTYKASISLTDSEGTKTASVTYSITAAPVLYTADVSVTKDGTDWTGQKVELYQEGSAKYTLTYSDGKYTNTSVLSGTYNVYVNDEDTGSTVSDENATLALEYFTVSYSKGTKEEITGTLPESAIVLKGSTYTVSTDKPLSIPYYTQIGWRTLSDSFYGGIGNCKTSIEVTKATTLYPVWEFDGVTKIYTQKYGEAKHNSKTDASFTYDKDTDLVLTHALSDEDAAKGIEIKNLQWYKGEGDTKTEITDATGATLTVPASDLSAGDYVYTLKGDTYGVYGGLISFTTIYKGTLVNPTYTITYNLNGGEGTTPAQQTPNVGTAFTAATNTNFSRTGYTFLGWATGADATVAKYNGGASVSDITTSTTLYAVWTINEYTITFDSNGGSAVESIKAAYGAAITAPAAPTKTGYTFAGWEPELPTTMPLNGLSVKAKWDPNTNTEYKVKHYQQNLADDEYTLVSADTETKTGTTDTATAAQAKDYEGFTAQSVTQSTIAADGSTVVEIYYNRKKFTVSIATNNASYGSVTESSIVNLKYGTPISVNGNVLTVGNVNITAAASAQTETNSYYFKTWTNVQSIVDGNETITAEFITKIRVSEPTANTTTFTYEGSVQEYIPQGFDSNVMSIANNTRTDAGSQTVTVTLKNTDTHEWKGSKETNPTFTFNIGKADVVISVDIAPIIKTYGDTWSLPTATFDFGTVTPDKTVADMKDVDTYTVTYTVAGTDNYNGDTETVTVTINPLPVNITWGNTENLVFDNTEKTITYTLANEVSGDNVTLTVEGTVSATEKGTYTATVTAVDNANYTLTGGANLTKQWSIAETTNSWESALNISGWTYGDTASTPTATAKFGTPVFTYADSVDGAYSEAVPTTAGTYYVKATVEGTTSYAEISDTKEFVIEAKTLNADNITAIADVTFTGDEIKPTLEIKDGDYPLVEGTDYDVTYSDNINASTTETKAKAAVTFKGNYQGTAEKAFTILPKQISNAIVLTAPVRNAAPQTEITGDGYTATVVWSPEVTDKFAYSTEYTATITITPDSNHTVVGIGENGYTVEGAKSVTSAENSNVITVTYEKTGSRPSSGGSSSSTTTTTTKNDDGSTTKTTTNKTTGTVTETTTNPDGSTTTVETKKDGTVTTTEKDKDGNTTTTVENPDGTSTTTEKTTDGTTTVTEKDADGTTTTIETDKAGNKTVTTENTDGSTVTEETKKDGTKVVTETNPDGETSATVETKKETEVTIPVENADEVTKVVVTDKDGNKTEAEFTVTDGGVAITVDGNVAVSVQTGHICYAKDFTDVDLAAWYHENVCYVLGEGLMKGTATDKFAPNDNLTRAMLVTILYRAEGEPATNRSIPFSDVDMGSWYASAVIWAQQNGIVKGVSETEFAPNDNITREQIAAILYRYAQYKGFDTTQGGMAVREFEDYETISEYAKEAMQWTVNAGLIKGYENNTVRPLNNATRAEAAALLQRFLVNNK